MLNVHVPSIYRGMYSGNPFSVQIIYKAFAFPYKIEFGTRIASSASTVVAGRVL